MEGAHRGRTRRTHVTGMSDDKLEIDKISPCYDLQYGRVPLFASLVINASTSLCLVRYLLRVYCVQFVFCER